MIAWIRSNSRSSTFRPRSSRARCRGSSEHDVLQRAHPAHLPELVEEVVEVELARAELALELLRLRLVVAASRPSRSGSCTSPMPRIRCAIRSGWKRSNCSSRSPVEANRIGLPVTALTDSAAPPRASPSSLVMTTPSKSHDLGERSRHVDRVLAGHRVDDEQDVVSALDRLADLGELGHQLLVDVQAAAGVDDQHVLALLARALAAPSAAISTGSRVGAAARRPRRRPARRPSRAARPPPGARRRRPPRATDEPCSSRSQRASLPSAVVLPEPCSPAIRMTVGGRGEKASSRAGAAHQRGQLLVRRS